MNITREFKLGAFILAVSASLAFLVLTFGEIPLFRPKTKNYTVYFRDVGGLSRGAEVRVAGIRAGRVEEVVLENARVRVVFSVEEGVKLFRDARATIGTLGLMGDKYLAISPGSPVRGELKEGSTLSASEEVADTDILIRELTETARSFKLVAQNLNSLLVQNRESISRTIENLNELTATLKELFQNNQRNLEELISQMSQLSRSLNKTLPEAIASIDKLADELTLIASENRENLKLLVSNLRQISGELKGELPALVKNLNDLSLVLSRTVKENRENIRRSVRNISEITENLKASSRRLDNILARIEEGRGTIGKLVVDETLYDSVSKGAKLFGEAGEVITRTRIYVGFGGEAYSQGDSKGYMSFRIEPDRKTYYLLEVVGDSRGRVYTEQIVGGDEIVRKEFKPELTLQIAKKFFMGQERYIAIRAGLKESTGGVGFDFIPRKGFRLYSDLWDAGRKDRPSEKGLKPNLQIGLQFKLKGPLYGRVGGDDLLNDRFRGAFLGLGLEFSEEYLKYLLGATGLPFP